MDGRFDFKIRIFRRRQRTVRILVTGLSQTLPKLVEAILGLLTAIRFFNIAAHGGDPARLFIGGLSAGGHYTALASVRRDWQETLGLPADVVRGCLTLSGVFLFGEDAGMKMRPRFLGDRANDHAASPMHHIDAPPPFLIACGDGDFPHLMRQAGEMTAALEAAGGDVEFFELPGRDHFSSSTAGGEPDGPWVPHALDWMARHK